MPGARHKSTDVKKGRAPAKLRLKAMCLLLVMAAGCTNALNYDVATLTDRERVAVRRALNAEQARNLDDWMKRQTIGGQPIPPGITVKQALMEQKDWIAEQKSEKAAKEAASSAAQAERLRKQHVLASKLSVAVLSKGNMIGVDEQRYVRLEIEYKNGFDKDIRKLEGVLRFTDVYGKAVMDLKSAYTSGIRAHETVVDRGSVISINRSIDTQEKLWETDFEKLVPTFDVGSIVFSDGSTVESMAAEN